MGISSYCIQMSETEAAAGVTYGSPRSYPDEISGPEFFCGGWSRQGHRVSS